ncbi:UDP-2,3-diacylglucosamine diphosphatase [Limibacter armeniacum]|uniref:UDP-2,3-diacylglucosamine diphosphatase n=1 Tax=Limibacter armeniacum TaxID=466084 RepID=UPI002FE6A4C0
MHLPEGKKVYFASDFHLGTPSHIESRKREDKIVRWLEQVRKDAAHIYLMGDMFDFWFEYSTVVPKGFIRFQGKLAEITDSGIPITFFTGNHDMWIFDYFTKELGIEVVRKPIDVKIAGKSFMLGHGDGLGPGDFFYKILKRIFANKVCQWLFGFIHPNIGIGIANFWSQSSRAKNMKVDEGFYGKEGEWLWVYCNEQEAEQHRDFYVFGHRHLPLDLEVGESSRYVNLGEWLSHYTYAEFDGENLNLLTFEDEPSVSRTNNSMDSRSS